MLLQKQSELNNLKAPLDGAFYYYGYHVLCFPIDFIRSFDLVFTKLVL